MADNVMVNFEPVTRKRRSLKGYVVIVALLFAFAAGTYGYCNYVYSRGGYSGYIRKISKKGFVKTWEGELDKRKMGGAYHTQDIFVFSVMDDTVAEKIRASEESGEWVTIHYRQYLVTLPWRGKTTYIVYDVTHSKKVAE